LSPRESCRSFFKEQGILTQPSVFIFECIIYAHKNIENTPLNSDHHSHDTRNKNLVRPIGHRLAKMSKSFVCMSVRLFNRLPENIKSLAAVAFRREVKKYLVDNTFYSIDEMLSGNTV
jgi:hypothetical protein